MFSLFIPECPSFQSCTKCITHGCQWVLHVEEPDVCLANHLFSPYVIDYAVYPGGVCPPEEVKEVEAGGVATWIVGMFQVFYV